MRKLNYIALVFLVTFINCLHPVLEHEIGTSYFLRAYLFEGQPVRGVSVKEILYFHYFDDFVIDSVVNQESHVPDVIINLFTDDESYTLTRDSTSNDSTFSCSHIIEAGKTYRIEVIIVDSTGNEMERLSAITKIPNKNATIGLDSNTLLVDSISMIGKYLDVKMNPEKYPCLTIAMNASNQKYHILLFQCISSTGPVFPNAYLPTPVRPTPFEGDTRYISLADCLYYGYYLVSVYHVNEEYANLYFENDNPEDTWSLFDTKLYPESISNVENGNGIFTGVACDTLLFTIAPEHK